MRKMAKAKARKRSEEKELLGRCDGWATAAGRESEMRSAESVRPGIVLRGPKELG